MKTKLPLQVLPVVEGNSEKIRFRIKHVIWEYIGLNIKLSIRISHRIFLISYRRVGWSLTVGHSELKYWAYFRHFVMSIFILSYTYNK